MLLIKVNKKSKRLFLIEDQKIIFNFPCALGINEGRKLKAGDKKTPEGEYEVIAKNPLSQHFRSLGLDYPNEKDIADAFEKKIITKRVHDELLAKRKKKFVDWQTPLGGEIYIHGGLDNGKYYTDGCVKLFNRHIGKIYKLADIGTKVIIF